MENTPLQETAVALCINGICQCVMMASPSDLEAFALGFALSEGFITQPDDILSIDCEEQCNGWQVNMTVLASVEHRLKQRRRLMTGPSGCGLCGIASLGLAMELPNQEALSQTSASAKSVPSADIIQSAVNQLPAFQKQFNCARGHHGAAFFTQHGELIELAEDVGRHSALDKLIGRLAKHTPNVLVEQTGFSIVTSRCSHDLVIKASRSGISTLVTLAPPTDLAVKSAQKLALALFCYQQGQLKQFV